MSRGVTSPHAQSELLLCSKLVICRLSEEMKEEAAGKSTVQTWCLQGRLGTMQPSLNIGSFYQARQ